MMIVTNINRKSGLDLMAGLKRVLVTSGKSTWIAVAVALAALAGVILFIANIWTGLGDVRITTGGWVALILGVVVTMVVGVGLMSLVFISDRRGFDEIDGTINGGVQNTPPANPRERTAASEDLAERRA